MIPRKLKKWLIIATAVAYLVFPRDLIPDFFARGLGLIDDAFVIAMLTYYYRKRVRPFVDPATRQSAAGSEREHSEGDPAEEFEGPPDPYRILGVDASASGEEIDAAYKARMQQYHPDKVAHLGEELQAVAHRKAIEIQQAYEQLRR